MRNILTIVLFLLSFVGHTQCIVINEILVDGATCDGSCNPNTSEWVELYNTCGSDVDVSCYILCDGDWTYVIPEGTTISAYGFLTIGGATNESTNPDLYWDGANYSGTGGIGTFTNSAEQLALFDESGSMIDGVVWGGGQGLQDNSNPVTSSGSCTVTNVSLPKSNNSAWETLPTDGNDCALARDTDGSSTWVRRCRSDGDISFGTTNGGSVPLTLSPPKITIQTTQDTIPEKKIIRIFTIDGRETIDIRNNAVYIIMYDDYSRNRVIIVK
jgi:hypothetical protein